MITRQARYFETGIYVSGTDAQETADRFKLYDGKSGASGFPFAEIHNRHHQTFCGLLR